LTIDRELIRQVRSLDQYDLRRLLILVKGMMIQAGDMAAAREADEPGSPLNVTYRQQAVNCGKPACSKCPHGPYWYAYWREGGKVRSRYIGRSLPATSRPPVGY
jgi:hypothetical protein